MSGEAKICKVGELFEKELQIPPYQRPYAWDVKNVKRLLDDILHYLNDEYLIGNMILHANGTKFDIIDGQQRLVTLALVLKVCEVETKFLDQNINPNSKYNLVRNYSFIQRQIQDSKKKEIAEFINEKLNLTYCVVNEIDDVFVVFDTQNTLGKPLTRAELLKNHHFMHVDSLSATMQKQIAKEWKKYQNMVSWNNFSMLEATLNELYIARQIFKANIFSLGNYINYNDLAFNEFLGIEIRDKGYSRTSGLKFSSSIIKGAEFFSYTIKYCEFYVRLFESANFCQKYYVNQAMIIMLLIYVDKFGIDNNFKRFFECIFIYLFIVLAENTKIRHNCKMLVNNSKDAILTRIFGFVNTSDFSSELIDKLENDIKVDFEFDDKSNLHNLNKAFELLNKDVKSEFLKEKIESLSFYRIKFKGGEDEV